jgi:curved DNA-binding protein CbpA
MAMKPIIKFLYVFILCFCASSIFTLIPVRIPLMFATALSTDILESNQSWKDWNYYQLLGLFPDDYYYKKDKRNKSSEWNLKSRRDRRKERGHIQSKDIKKSYRKQAQAWHPDKIASRKKQQTNSTNSNGIDYTNVSVEECNSRFAKIAEAYEVLNDEEKRLDYDMFLLDTEDQMDIENRQQNVREGKDDNGASSFSNAIYEKTNAFFQDPMSTFEDFFFGGNKNDPSSTEGDGARNSENDVMDDLFESFYGGSRRDQQQQSEERYYNRQPDRTSEKTQVRYDPRRGRDIMNVFQREEFDEPRKRQIYFRIIAQEFVQEVDAYGRPIGFSPITEPRIVEEGYTPLKDQRKKRQNKKQHKRRRPLSLTSNRLEKHEYITPESLHLHSSGDGEYYAGLTLECELVIMHDEGPFEEDTLFWTSNTYVPPHHRDGCALAMYGARIAIIVGDVENPSTFLWSSPPPPPIVPGTFEGEEFIDFYLSLDDDGSLVVYRSRIQEDGEEFIHECVYATGQAGCHSAGRRFVIISNTIKRSVEKVVSQLDEKVGEIIDSLNQDRNDGIPLFAIVKRRVQNIALKVRRMYALIHPKILNITKIIKQYFQKLSSRVDEKVSGIMDSLYEIGEDDIDLFDTVLCILGKGFQNIMNKIK